MPMYPEQKQPACSLGLDPEPYVISLSHILPMQNRSENNSGCQKKIKILQSITIRYGCAGCYNQDIILPYVSYELEE